MTTPYILPLYLFGREREFQRVGMSATYKLMLGGEECSVFVNGNAGSTWWQANYIHKLGAGDSAQAACEALENELVPLATVLAGIAGKQ